MENETMEPSKSAVELVGLERDTFAGQVAVITGAGRGIGREIGLAFAWLGARVVLAEFTELGRETEEMIRAKGGEAFFVQTNVADPASVAALAEQTHQKFGPVTILINNAIVSPVIPALEMDVEVWDRVMAVNLRGTFLTCKTFLPDMIAKAGGTIVNMISSEAMPGLSAYIASKQGINGFSQSLAIEVGQHEVRVIAFAPGMVDTPGMREAAHDLAPRLNLDPDEFMNLSLHPAYEGLMPADHAAAATAYLVAELAEEYHGQSVNGYTVLEQAGLIASPSIPDAAPAAKNDAGIQPNIGRVDLIEQATSLTQQLAEIIAQTDEEFNRLPVFIRPMARSGFRGKSGQSIHEWTRTTTKLIEQLKELEKGDERALSQFLSSSALTKELLGKLKEYYRGVPVETARFTKDADLLRSITLQMEVRMQLVDDLISTLESLK